MIQVTKSFLPNINQYMKYIDLIFSNGQLTNNGPLVRELESRLTDYLGVKNLILVSNGTVALNVAYLALGLVKGEVVTTPFSFVATTSSLCMGGMTPIFVDIDLETFNINPDNIVKGISSQTKAIVPVHVFGNACNVDLIDKISKQYDLKVVYDAAHAFGVSYKNNSILNFGDVSTLSFHATKLFHTIEGGAIVTKDDDLACRIRKIINFGIENEGSIPYLGTNAKMNEFEAAMGLCVIEHMDDILECRKHLYETYERNLSGYFQLQKINSDCTRNYSYFPIVCRSENQLLDIKNMLNSFDIYPRRYFYPSLNRLQFLNSKDSDVQNAETLSSRVLCLPLYADLEASTQAKIIELLKKMG